MNINLGTVISNQFKIWSVAEKIFDFENLFLFIELKFYLKFLFVTNQDSKKEKKSFLLRKEIIFGCLLTHPRLFKIRSFLP